MRRWLICLSLSTVLTSGLSAQESKTKSPDSGSGNSATQEKKPNPDTQPMVQAKAFLATLTDEQKTKAVLPFDSEKRVGWHFIPMATRKGLPLMEMTAEQQAAAMKLLRSSVSQTGYERAEKIMGLETLLKAIEGTKGQNERNPVKYYFTIFGQPAPKERWGMSVEGHHLSLNFVFNGNRIIDSTPQFFATNPAIVKDNYDGFKKGMEVLKPEQQLAIELVESLTEQQKQKATLAGDTPKEIRGAGEPQPPRAAAAGISVSEMNESQRDTLKKLLTAYTNKMKQGVAQSRWQLIEEADWNKVQFGWSGGTKDGQGRYYVVQGPTFLVEFINVQPDAAGNPANHIHCVWRDMTGDFDLPAQ